MVSMGYTGIAGYFWRCLLYAISAVILLFLAMPILVVLPISFSSEIYFSYPLPGWSLQWYQEIFTNPRWFNAAVNSCIVAFATVSLSLAIGTLAALGLSRRELPGRAAILGFTLAPLIVPTVITSVGIFFFYAKLNLINTYIGLIIAHTVIAVPLVVILILATLKGFDANLARAGAGLGANSLQVFYLVTLPLIMPGFLSAAIFAFVTSFDEVVLVLFLGGPELRTLPREMWKSVREQTDPTIMAASAILVAVTLVLLIAVEWLRRREGRVSR